MKKLFFLISLALLFVSCEKDFTTDLMTKNDVQIQTQLDVTDLTDFETATKPDQPGDNMKVYRGEYYTVLSFFDADRGLGAIVGLDVPFACETGIFDISPINFQDIYVNDDGDVPRIVSLVKGYDVPVFVANADAHPCDKYFDDDYLYMGTVDYVGTDNDLLAGLKEEPNHNTWGWRMHGDGLTIIWKALWDGENPETFKLRVNIMVK